MITDFDIELDDIPFKTIQILFNNKFPNIDEYEFTLIHFFSNETIVLFYYLSKYEMLNWDDSNLNMDFEWKMVSCPLSEQDTVHEGINTILTEIKDIITGELHSRFIK